MSTAPPSSWTVTRLQATRLQEYVQTYRCHALAAMLPGPDRNTTLRVLQMFQSKLIDILDQNTLRLRLAVTQEERAALQTMTIALLILYGKKPETGMRNATISDLIALSRSLKSL